jgi:hypothetical protein
MNTYILQARKTLGLHMMKQLEKRNMDAYYCDTKEDALAQAISLLQPGKSVSWGGSASLEEIGLIDHLKAHTDDFIVYDRDYARNNDEKKKIYQKAATCDYYFMSSNAITKDGILVNMDGNGNRVAALCNGPEHVVLVIGMNKVCNSVDEAIDRIHLIAGPANAMRLNLQTACSLAGDCKNCLGKDCICSQLVITRYNSHPGRLKIILVGEDLGF